MTAFKRTPRRALVGASTALAWLGFYIHNVAELAGQTIFSPETGLPTLVTLVLFLLWWRFPFKHGTIGVLLGWSLLNLIGGGILSVLPLPFLPFAPEQTARHYLLHGVYGAAQLPLIGILVVQFRHTR